MICDQCETVAHCMKHGCVPKQPMPTKDEALKMALEALEAVLSDNQPYTHKSKAAITAIKQSLAAPVQEPYAWHYKNAGGVSAWHFGPSRRFDADLDASERWPKTHQLIPVYTTPPTAQRQWVGLSQEEIENCYGGEVDDFARAIEAKLKEKNT